MNYSSLSTYYKSIYNLVQMHRFGSITEIENMMPFERDVYVSLLKDELQKKEEEQRRMQAMAEARSRKGY